MAALRLERESSERHGNLSGVIETAISRGFAMILALPILVLLCGTARAADRPDILLADFEGETYGDGWRTTGAAFGKGPAKGTLPNQMPVSGFLGKGLVNSFAGGDASTGTLTSSAF